MSYFPSPFHVRHDLDANLSEGSVAILWIWIVGNGIGVVQNVIPKLVPGVDGRVRSWRTPGCAIIALRHQKESFTFSKSDHFLWKIIFEDVKVGGPETTYKTIIFIGHHYQQFNHLGFARRAWPSAFLCEQPVACDYRQTLSSGNHEFQCGPTALSDSLYARFCWVATASVVSTKYRGNPIVRLIRIGVHSCCSENALYASVLAPVLDFGNHLLTFADPHDGVLC